MLLNKLSSDIESNISIKHQLNSSHVYLLIVDFSAFGNLVQPSSILSSLMVSSSASLLTLLSSMRSISSVKTRSVRKKKPAQIFQGSRCILSISVLISWTACSVKRQVKQKIKITLSQYALRSSWLTYSYLFTLL